MIDETSQMININSPALKGLDTSASLSKAVEQHKLHKETFEDAWDRILAMKNTVPVAKRLNEVRDAMDKGTIGRQADRANKKFSKSEALLMWAEIEADRAKERLAEMVRDTPDNYWLITSEERLDELLAIVDDEDEVVFDVETTGVDVWKDYVVGHVITAIDADIHAYIPTRHDDPRPQLDNDYVNERLRPYYEDESLGKLAHNAGFDIHMLDREGLTLKGLTWDTQEAMKLLNENEKSFALKPLVTRYLKINSATYGELFGQVGFNTVPLDEALAYAAKDGDVTRKMRDFQRYHLAKMPTVLEYFESVEVPLIQVVVAMEKEGYVIDMEFAEKYGQELREEALEVGARVVPILTDAYNNGRRESYDVNKIQKDDKVTISDSKGGRSIEVVAHNTKGVVTLKKSSGGTNFPSEFDFKVKESECVIVEKAPIGIKEEININSPQQLKEAIEGYVNRPIADTDAKRTLKPLSRTVPLIKDLLHYREVSKLSSTYIESLPKLIEDKTGRLHTQLHQNGAVTGRFSSGGGGFNIQNQPKEARSLFIAPEGYYIVGADFSAQEVRMIASVSEEDILVDAFRRGVDPYATIASDFFGKPYEECYKLPNGKDTKEREQMKLVMLMSMYGASKYGLSPALGLSLEEADKFKDDFFKKYSKIDAFIKRSQAFAKKYGYVWIGEQQRKRRLPESQWKRRWIPSGQYNNPKYEADKKHNASIGAAMRQGPNAEVQGLAAIQTKATLLEIDRLAKERGWRHFGAIHDEIIMLFPKTATAEDFRLFDEAMTQTHLVPNVDNGTDIEVQVRWGNSISAEEFLSGTPVPESEER